MTILYFTATGNNLYLAKKIGGNLISIPKAIKEGNLSFKDDKIGIIFPIYGWAVPQIVREFLQKVKLESGYIFAVTSYGMIAGAATDHLLALASENGIHFSYINTIKMVDNYLPGFKMEKQIETEPKKQIDYNLDLIIKDIETNKQWVPNNSLIKRFMTKRLLKFDQFKNGIGITDKYFIEDTCNKCGTCAKVCPTDNIQLEGTKPIFDKKCVSCLSCTHNCPQNAIHMTNEKSKIRFRNQHISLKEIIDANS